MNRKMIVYTLGKMLEVEGILMLIPFLTAIIYHESAWSVYLICALLTFLVGFLLSRREPKNKNIYAKEGYVIVALAWILFSAFGAIPFVMSQDIPRYIDAFFETVSGFTTTGSSILNDIEALSHASLLWRSFSHWIGGMGILVFVLAFLPLSSGRSMHIMRAEMPGPVVGKLVSKVRVTARILYIIYGLLTALETILLMAGGLPFFDSLLNSFATAGTGGFAIYNSSIAYYDSAYVDGVITVFMILFGINFNLIYLAFLGKIKDALKSEELHWYLGLIGISTLVITFNIVSQYGDQLATAFRYAVFQVSSIITTTGFVTADYEQWPMLSQIIIVCLTFIGACAGSTGGGIKVSRIMMIVKNAKAELKRLVHPRSVSYVELEHQAVEPEVINNVYSYLTIYVIVFVVSMLLLSLQGLNFESIFTAVATCINNVGPGLGAVGPTSNFASLSDLSKLVLSFDMLAGRLEIFPMIILFSPRLWRS